MLIIGLVSLSLLVLVTIAVAKVLYTRNVKEE
jgi:hypothetical protein